MTNYLGEWFQGIRLEAGWTPGEVARRLGYLNVSKGCNKLQRFEREGVVGDDFLDRLALLLGVPEGVVRYLIRADRLAYRRAWEEWAGRPVPVSVVVRAVPGFLVGVPLPADATTPERAVAHAQALAARLHKKVFVTLSRRVTVGVTESGDINGHFYARPDSDPCPPVSPGRAKFLMRLGGYGESAPGEPSGDAP